MKISKAKAYQDAGVNINAGYESVRKIKPLVEHTRREEVLSSLGGFGGLFELDTEKFKNPVLVSGTDGVGTKLKLAFELDIHNTVGIDCVAMCVNDIICSGAEPLIFLDYIACNQNVPEKIASIIEGMAQGCIQAGCALIGGETAEMPGFYSEGEYDIAGFSVGVVSKDKIIDGSKVTSGDVLIGLASSGVHSNGFSLIRKIIKDNAINLKNKPEILKGKSIGDCLLEPTNIYVPVILKLIKRKLAPLAISHITGGGFYENIPRMLPEGLQAEINLSSFPIPPIFNWIKQESGLGELELYSTFNMGIGMVLVVKPDKVQETLDLINKNNFKAYEIGKVTYGENGVVLKN